VVVKWLSAIVDFLAALVGGFPVGNSDTERERKNKRKSDLEAWKKQHGTDWDKLK
jgi:hypothetical protein